MSKTKSAKEGEGMKIPPNFKTYMIQDRWIVTQSPRQEKPTTLGKSYDGLEEVKQLDLAQPREEPKPVYIATNLQPHEEELLIQTLQQY